jgi:hypothetical protein
MALPPAIPEPAASFAKHPKEKRHSSHRRARDRVKDTYDDDEFRRGLWLIVMVVLVLLTVGGGLVFSGLI